MTKEIDFQRVQLTDEEIGRQLTVLERQHGMTSAEFRVKYDAGRLGDAEEFIRWSGLLRAADRAGALPLVRT